MVRSTVKYLLLVLATLVLVSGLARAGQKGDKGDKGDKKDKDAPQWDWTIYDDNDKEVAKGHFVVRGFTLWNGNGKKVGSYEDVGENHVKADINEGKWFKGKLDLTTDDKSKGKWKGEIENGKVKYKVVLIFERYRK